MAGIVLLFINEKQFRDLRGDVMPMKVLAEVDVAKEMRGGTLKFPTGKKRLVDVTEEFLAFDVAYSCVYA